MKDFKNSYITSTSKIAIVMTLFFVALFSCKNKEQKPDDTMMEEPMEEEMVMAPTLEKGCYMYNENGSMVNLEITKTDNPVEGSLIYALAEKDKNTGTFRGQFNDGKLVGTYTFQSEGKESKRQVAYMLKDNQLVEGYGELNADGTMFKDVNSVNYSSTMPLTKTDCNQ
ncbi:MAG: hypothetical protein ABIO60_02510 [Aquaticitalea sp.]